MIQLTTKHVGADTGGELAQLAAYTAQLQAVRQSAAYEAAESSLNLPDDPALLEQVQTIVSQKVDAELQYNIVVGIGGSNLGTKAVYDALLGYRDQMEPGRFPKLLFAETTDPEWLAQACKLIETLESSKQVLITLISKSGGTTETIANFEIIMQALRSKFGEARERVVAITDEGSKLWEAAGEQGMARLSIPQQVGGRYSVLSAVGLLPLATVGIDIAALRKGASELLDNCFGADSNMAARSAAALVAGLRRGFSINDNFFFHPELESLGKWYRQLMGESIGKEKSLTGETVHAGITPTVSLGSTDLHSVGQLYLGGPKDKFTTFVSSAQSNPVAVPSENRVFPGLVPAIAGTPASEVMAAILEGTQVAYQKAAFQTLEAMLLANTSTVSYAWL